MTALTETAPAPVAAREPSLDPGGSGRATSSGSR